VTGQVTPPGSPRLAEIFDRLSQQLLDEHPEDHRGRMLSSPGLTTAGRFYAFVTGHDLVVKLPAGRVAELIATGAGRPCAPARRGPMREWVRLAPDGEDDCGAYLHEARAFLAATARGCRQDQSTRGA